MALRLHAYHAADAIYAPTHWQRSRIPEPYRTRATVIFDGTDTNLVKPDPNAIVRLRKSDLAFRPGDLAPDRRTLSTAACATPNRTPARRFKELKSYCEFPRFACSPIGSRMTHCQTGDNVCTLRITVVSALSPAGMLLLLSLVFWGEAS